MRESLRVLLVEDSENDAFFTLRALSQKFLVTHKRVQSAAEMEEALTTESWDIVISDHNLPRFSGPAAFATLQHLEVALPFILVSGTIGEEAAVEAMRLGIDDYILKNNLIRLLPAVSRELHRSRISRERSSAIREHELAKEQSVVTLRDAAEMQAAVATLGKFALHGGSLPQVFDMAVSLSRDLLNADLCGLFKLLPDKRTLRLQASFGWSGAEGVEFAVGDLSHPSYAFKIQEPVVFENLAAETRFAPSALMLKQGVASGLAVIISGVKNRFGVLTAHSLQPKVFAANEVNFLQAIANVVAAAMERNLFEAQLNTADRMATVGQMAAGVAHEINNPLTYVTSNLEMIATSLEASGQHSLLEMLTAAQEGVERVRLVVKDLTIFSRTSEEKMAPVCLAKVIDSSIRMGENQIRHRALLVKEFGEAPAVLGNEGRVGQVILNLLINAAQAIPEGNPLKNEIRVNLSTDDAGNALVTIRDSGEGIPATILSSIFDPFFTTKAPGVGTGLGLSICRNIITKMNGELRVDSQEGVGTTVRITLPPSLGYIEPSAPKLRAAENLALGPEPRLRILLLDDEALLITAMALSLSKIHDVVFTTDPYEALDLVAKEGLGIDVIFCDLMMARMTGMGFFEEVRARFPELEKRIIFMTGGVFTEGARKFLETVPNPRLLKPFNLREIRELLRTTR